MVTQQLKLITMTNISVVMEWRILQTFIDSAVYQIEQLKLNAGN